MVQTGMILYGERGWARFVGSSHVINWTKTYISTKAKKYYSKPNRNIAKRSKNNVAYKFKVKI